MFAVKDNKSSSIESPNNLTETERGKLLAMVLGMAIDAYGYDPANTRNAATGTNHGGIAAGLAKAGLSADPKTIRKYLEEAANLYLRRKPRNS